MHVVCGLIFSNDRVLATRRDPRGSCPLKWEFPGGKLEDGESAREALMRELVEELDFKVRITSDLEPVCYSGDGHDLVLIPFICVPDQDAAPRPIDHTEIRWIQPGKASLLDWAPADIPLVNQLPELEKIPRNHLDNCIPS